MKKIYITGNKGMLGSALTKSLSSKYKVFGSDIEIDIRDYEKLKSDVEKVNPDYIIHCASIIDVDYCETNKDEVYEINVKGTENICLLGKKVIYISTHAVYEGTGNHKETGIPNPANYYSHTKLKGEQVVKKDLRNLILRINIIGRNKNKAGFLEWLYGKLETNQIITAFNDIIFQPLHVNQVGNIIDEMIDRKGIYNIGCMESTTKEYFIRELLNRLSKYQCNITSINDDSKVRRPNVLSVEVTKVLEVCSMPSLDEVFKECIKEYKNG